MQSNALDPFPDPDRPFLVLEDKSGASPPGPGASSSPGARGVQGRPEQEDTDELELDLLEPADEGELELTGSELDDEVSVIMEGDAVEAELGSLLSSPLVKALESGDEDEEVTVKVYL